MATERAWTKLKSFVGPEPKRGQHGRATCQVQVSDDEHPRYSFCLGFTSDTEFKSVKYLPRNRLEEFQDVLDQAAEEVEALVQKTAS